jgi:hypothetical protein
MIEMAVVVGLTVIAAMVAVVRLRQATTLLDADRASNLVVEQLRYARQIAVDQRRNVDVGFVGSNRITVTRQDGGGNTTLLSNLTLPSGYTFGLPGAVGDTPDGYGNAFPVSLGLGTSGTFLGDGTFVNAPGFLTNGSIFTIASGNGTARAVTLAAASGRVKQYYIKGGVWVER